MPTNLHPTPLPREKLVISTDIGTDIDDALAVYLAATNPSIDLRGVWVTNGDVHTRATIARKLLSYAGSRSPVWHGEANPIDKSQKPYQLDFEEGFTTLEKGETIDEVPEKTNGLEELCSLLQREDGVVLASIAPLTNLARLVQEKPELCTRVRMVYAMACRKDKLEHNIRYDIEAARIVFSSQLPLTIIPGDICDGYRLDSPTLVYGLPESKAHDFISEMAYAWLYKKEWPAMTALMYELKQEKQKIQIRGTREEQLSKTALLQRLEELEHHRGLQAYQEVCFTLHALSQNPEFSYLSKKTAELRTECCSNRFAVHDVYTLFGILHPHHLKTMPVHCEFDHQGATTLQPKGPHQWATSWDYDEFRRFLHIGLGIQPTELSGQ